MEDLAGSRFDHYVVEDEIGRGGMAIVYRARHVRLDRICALKILRPELADDERFVERFLREAQRSAQLEHPHIVPIYDTGRSNRYYFIAMKYLPGRTLRQQMDQGPLEPPLIADYLVQTASALDYAHGRGIVHRDIKPGNMVIDDQRFLTLTDFGLARASDDMHLTVTGTLMGTPAYMAPEQVQGKVATPPTDVYQLGIVAYELLSGDTPFGKRAPFALLNAHLNEPPEPLHERAPGLPPELSAVVARALAKDAGDRYQTSGEFVAALVQYIPGAEAWSRTSAVFEPDETDRLYRGAVAADETTRPRQPVVPVGGTDPFAETPPLIQPDPNMSDSERTAVELGALGGLAAGAAGAALHAPFDVTQGATMHEAQSPFAGQGATVHEPQSPFAGQGATLYDTPAPFIGQSATVYEMQAPSGGSTSGQWVAPVAAGATAAGGGFGEPPTYVVPPAEGAPERSPRLLLLLAAVIGLFLLLGGVGAAFAAGLFDGGGGGADSTATPTETVAATLTTGPLFASATVTATSTEDAGPTASATDPVRVTTTPRALPTATATSSPTPSPSPSPTATPSPTPEPTWTPEPTATPPPPPTSTPVPPPPPPTNTPVPPPPPPTNTPVPPPPPPTATSPPPPTPTQITVPTVGP